MRTTRRRSWGRWCPEGYRQVETVEEADLVLYNTCSIRDKAEQKVFNRLNDYKKLQETGEEVWRARLRGAAGGRKDFRARALGVAGGGSASYRNLPEMLRAAGKCHA